MMTLQLLWCFLTPELRIPLSVVLLFQSREVPLPIPRLLPHHTKSNNNFILYIHIYIIIIYIRVFVD